MIISLLWLLLFIRFQKQEHFWLLFILNLDRYCKRRTIKTTKDMQSDLRFMGRDLKVRNQWKHSDAIACNTWDVWCSILRPIAFAFKLAPAKVELHLWSRLWWGRVCVFVCFLSKQQSSFIFHMRWLLLGYSDAGGWKPVGFLQIFCKTHW